MGKAEVIPLAVSVCANNFTTLVACRGGLPAGEER